jgi:hypothetical protein
MPRAFAIVTDVGAPLSRLKDLQVWMTMIGGETEYCASGQETFCPGPGAGGGI